MGFDGVVLSDWNGHAGTPEAGRPGIPGCTLARCDAAVNAGIDILMVPNDWKAMLRNTVQGVEDGRIPMARIDDAVRRILRVKLRAGLFDKGKPSARPLAGRQELLGLPQHRAIARQAVRESLVLLKNDAGLLPLSPGAHVLVTGPGADSISMQTGGWTLDWQGRGHANERYIGATSILAGIRNAVESGGGTVQYTKNGQFGERPDVAIVVFGEIPYAEFEGDRPDLNFSSWHPEGLKLLQQLNGDGVPIVSVFLTGRPVWITPELEASGAFVVAWLPGSEGQGIADVLFRMPDGTIEHDFYGRLGFSWPKEPGQQMLNRHDPDYDPLFSYGFGLDYADFNSEE
jgi:beta-glucosidase